jgi:uncharacterized protein
VTPAKAILIHGNGGCTAGDIWLPWLERELTAIGLDVVNQTFPDNMKARAQYWLPHIESLGADEHTILIGHSSGAVAAMRYAEQHRLLGSILVGVCHTDLGDSFEAASGYYQAQWQWQRIRDNQQWIARSPKRGSSRRNCDAATSSSQTAATSSTPVSFRRSSISCGEN